MIDVTDTLLTVSNSALSSDSSRSLDPAVARIGRLAPSPTGRMHLGNAFAALGAWLGAHAGAPSVEKSAGAVEEAGAHAGAAGLGFTGTASTAGATVGRVLLRIEDIDTPRAVKEADRWIMDDFTWLGLDWDGEPVYQSQRTELYEQVLRGLSEKVLSEQALRGEPGDEWLIYPCYCTRAQLRAASAPQESDGFVVYPGTCRRSFGKVSQKSLSTESKISRFLPREGRHPAVRMAMPLIQENPIFVKFCDQIFGESSWNLPRDVGDIVLRRSDGLFAYQLAVVVDDYVQGVNQIVRGRDLLRSTAAQIWLRSWVAQVLDEMGIKPEQDPPAAPGAAAALVTGEPAAPPSAAAASTGTAEQQSADLLTAPPTPRYPEYAHLPLLLSEQHKRLAKRDESLELSTLRERGVSPQRIIGYLAWLMGITPEIEPCTPHDLLPEFSWEKIRRAGLADRQTEPSILAQ